VFLNWCSFVGLAIQDKLADITGLAILQSETQIAILELLKAAVDIEVANTVTG
jgi:hypothetical protein